MVSEGLPRTSSFVHAWCPSDLYMYIAQALHDACEYIVRGLAELHVAARRKAGLDDAHEYGQLLHLHVSIEVRLGPVQHALDQIDCDTEKATHQNTERGKGRKQASVGGKIASPSRCLTEHIIQD